jgi:hypothetical protein
MLRKEIFEMLRFLGYHHLSEEWDLAQEGEIEGVTITILMSSSITKMMQNCSIPIDRTKKTRINVIYLEMRPPSPQIMFLTGLPLAATCLPSLSNKGLKPKIILPKHVGN